MTVKQRDAIVKAYHDGVGSAVLVGPDNDIYDKCQEDFYRAVNAVWDHVYDFGWALRQMRAGLCVRRGHDTYCIIDGELKLWYGGGHDRWIGAIPAPMITHAMATDWTVCADPGGA